MTSPIPQPSADHPNTAGGVDASSVTVGYGQRTIIRDLSATFPAGKITTIVGPNGCGKSTLLRAMSGLLNLDTGTVSVDGQNISDMKRKDVARILGMLPQSPVAPEGLLVSDLVARGRHPHQAWFRQWSSTDEDAVFEALSKPVLRILPAVRWMNFPAASASAYGSLWCWRKTPTSFS